MEKVTSISKELVSQLKIVPINKFLVVRPEKIDSGSRIHLASSIGAEAMAGQALFVVDDADPECKQVKKGDYIINKADAKSMAEFRILDDVYFMINEEDIAVVLRS